MSSKIKVDSIADQGNNNLLVKCGSTLTIGATGNTITLASGASQSGFGRTGTVDWQTSSIKTAAFTPTSGEGYFCNTTSGGFTVNLPAGSAGAIISLQDYNNTFDTNNLIVSPNGSEKINGGAGDVVLSTEGEGITLVYIDSTVGWRSIQDNDFSTVGSNFVAATGGTETTSGNFKIHTFTGPGTFQVTSAGSPSPSGSSTVDYLVIAGAGSGGSQDGGGGGAGGYRESSGAASGCYTRSPLGACVSALAVGVQSYPIVVGGGGTAATGDDGSTGGKGNDSSFSTITSTGGGGGGNQNNSVGADGGSGGGGSGGGTPRGGGTGNSPPVSPPQGNSGGGPGGGAPSYGGSGGGGSGGAGTSANGSGNNGHGGCGQTSSINGTPTARAGGGGGNSRGGYEGDGKAGGGNGGKPGSVVGGAGTANSGSGGGGGCDSSPALGGNGGSGIVIIRYKYQ